MKAIKIRDLVEFIVEDSCGGTYFHIVRGVQAPPGKNVDLKIYHIRASTMHSIFG